MACFMIPWITIGAFCFLMGGLGWIGMAISGGPDKVKGIKDPEGTTNIATLLTFIGFCMLLGGVIGWVMFK